MKTSIIVSLIMLLSVSIAINVAVMKDNQKMGLQVWGCGEGIAERDEEISLLKNDLIQYEAIIATSTAQLRECKEEVKLWHSFMGEDTWKTIQKLSSTEAK